jgi:hypothetical protein
VCEVLKDLKVEKSLKCLNVEKVLKEKGVKKMKPSPTLLPFPFGLRPSFPSSFPAGPSSFFRPAVPRATQIAPLAQLLHVACSASPLSFSL